MDPSTLTPGDRVWRWVWTGGQDQEPQPLTVVRVNRVTVTVRTDQGSTFRLDPHLLKGHWTHDRPER